MAYTETNYKSKKAMIDAFKAGIKIRCFQSGGMFPLQPGRIGIEGPHYPKPHRWYASGVVDENMILISVK